MTNTHPPRVAPPVHPRTAPAAPAYRGPLIDIDLLDAPLVTPMPPKPMTATKTRVIKMPSASALRADPMERDEPVHIRRPARHKVEHPGEGEEERNQEEQHEAPGDEDFERYDERSGLPIIVITGRPDKVNAQDAAKALAQANGGRPTLFRRGGELVEIITDEDGHAIHVIGQDRLSALIDRAACWLSAGRKGPVACSVPKKVVTDIFTNHQLQRRFPELNGIITMPIVRKDGSVLQTAGYDLATKLCYLPDVEIAPVPESPSADDVQTARRIIDDLIVDFPFAEEASKTNAVALLLTPAIRSNVPVAPMAVIEAPTQGTGKSLLAELVSRVNFGRKHGFTSAPTRDEEWAKTLTSILREGQSFVVFDNVATRLNSPELALVLTSAFYAGRLMATNHMPRLRNGATWVMTSNNASLGPDFPRRCFVIRLDAQMHDPSQRTAFRHPDLFDGFLGTHRAEILHALLVLVRAWYAAGCPAAEKRVTMGSFEHWAKIVSGVLAFAGYANFMGNAARLRMADQEREQWIAFLSWWQRNFQDRIMTTGEVAKTLRQQKQDDVIEIGDVLPEALVWTNRQNEDAISTKLGQQLGRHKDQRFTEDGLRVVRHDPDRQNRVRWQVLQDTIEPNDLPLDDAACDHLFAERLDKTGMTPCKRCGMPYPAA